MGFSVSTVTPKRCLKFVVNAVVFTALMCAIGRIGGIEWGNEAPAVTEVSYVTR